MPTRPESEVGGRIAVAGSQWITEYLLRALLAEDIAPELLISIGPEHAEKISGYVDLAPLAAAHGLELYRPADFSLDTGPDREVLLARPFDVLLVFGWQRLVPGWLLDHCARGAFGVHGGPEKPPRCRGQAIFNWALILGARRFYMYLFKLAPEADSGEIVELTEFEITPHDDVRSLYHKNCVVSTRMILRNLPAILAGTVALELQPTTGATYLPGRRPEQGGIAWDDSAERIANLVRALAPPYPGAFTLLDGVRLVVIRAHVFDKIGRAHV